MIAPAIHQLAALCSAKGIEHVMLCPGSRSAPLALAFLRNGKFTCFTASDERSAAFIGLGIAEQTGRPVILVCTSGSAAYNFAPAVAEAFFKQIPLIVITADRPREWIDQLDGQTIRQPNLYGQHVKRFAELPQDYTHEDAAWYANRVTNEMLNLAESVPKGPVHLNTPFREPLYPAANEKRESDGTPRELSRVETQSLLGNDLWASIAKAFNKHKKVLIVAGQLTHNRELIETLTAIQSRIPIAVAGDILSNFHSLPSFCGHADTFLGQLPENEMRSLQPDLLITLGQSLVAKNLKLFLRKFNPKEHWHLQPGGEVADTFKNLTQILPVDPHYFFSELLNKVPAQPGAASFRDEWSKHESRTRTGLSTFFDNHAQGEFALVNAMLKSLPERCNLHLANSMSVRYANQIGLRETQGGVNVYSNRGTSGIDGCTSTAVGHALVSQLPNILLTGDQAFFYDRNAFWHNYPLPNLHIVVLNNHGGIIFNLIDGPAALPESEEYFVTRQSLQAKPLAAEFGFTYSDGVSPNWKVFFQAGNTVRIHELESSQSMNKSVFEAFRKHIRKSYEA